MKLLIALFFLCATPSFFAQGQAVSGQVDYQSYYPLPKDGKWCFSLSPDSVVSNHQVYDTIYFCGTPFGNPYYVAITGKNYQFYDPNLNELSSGYFRKLIKYNNRAYVQGLKDWFVFDLFEEESSTLIADSLLPINNSVYIYRKGKMGIIDYETRIEPIYDRIIRFDDPNGTHVKSMYLVLNGSKFGLIDRNGETVIPTVASIVQQEKFGIIKYKESNWKYLLPSGKIVNPNGNEIHFFSADQYKIYNSARTKSQFYEDGKLVQSTREYDDIFVFEKGYVVRKNDRIGLLSSSFRTIKSPFCDQLEPIQFGNFTNDLKSSDYFKYLIGEKWGIISNDGRIMTSALYSNVLQSLNEEGNSTKFKIAQDDKVGIIDKYGKMLIQPNYDNLERRGKGYISQLNKRVGYLSDRGEEVIKCEYSGYFYEGSEVFVFVKNRQYYFVGRTGKLLDIPPCSDYAVGNNIIKCYYDDRIDVHFLEKGNITETTAYPQIRIVQFRVKRHYHRQLADFDETSLELNQKTGLYGMRYKLKDGLKLEPTYPDVQESYFSGWFDAGIIADSNMTFQYANFPKLKAYRVYNWMSQGVGERYKDVVLSSRIFKLQRWSGGSDDCSILCAEKEMEWISDSRKDKIDPWVEVYGLLYDKNLENDYQKVFVDGSTEIVPIASADISMMDYFNYLNVARNMWFTNLKDARMIMNPGLGLKFVGGKVAIRDTRSRERKPFAYEVSEFKEDSRNLYYTFKKKGESTLNLCIDLMPGEAVVEKLISITEADNDFELNFILEKSIRGQRKKAVYNEVLAPKTDFIYDEIVPAGFLGYLVRIGQKYSYVEL